MSRLLNRRSRLIVDFAAVSIGEFSRASSLRSRRARTRRLDVRHVFIVVLLAVDVVGFGESLTDRQNRLCLLIHSFRASLSIRIRIGHLHDRVCGLEVLLSLSAGFFDSLGDGLITLSGIVGAESHVDALALGLAFEFGIFGVDEVIDPFGGGLTLLEHLVDLLFRDHGFFNRNDTILKH